MAQHDYVIDNASGATVRADINSALSAIQTLNSGTSAPSSTAAGMLWLDTTGGAPYVLKIRDAGNNHWITLTSVNDPGADSNAFLPAQINLPTSGGVFESDGSTEILTESSGAVTLKNTTIDSTVTFRTGQIIACKQWIDTSGDTTVNSNSSTALNESSASQNSFSATSGNSYLLSFTGTINIDTDGSSVRSRAGNLQVRYGTSAIADEATSLGSNTIEFSDNQIGRLLIAASSSPSANYASVSLDFIFTATSTATHYFNLVGNAGNVRNMVMFKNSNNPLVTRYFEIQGDVTA